MFEQRWATYNLLKLCSYCIVIYAQSKLYMCINILKESYRYNADE